MIVEVSNILLATRKNTQNCEHMGKNRHGDPIFLLQCLNVLYMTGIWYKFEKRLDSMWT